LERINCLVGANLYASAAIFTESKDNEREVIRLLLLEESPRTLPYNETLSLLAAVGVAPLIVHSHLLFFNDDQPRLRGVQR
jgi:hypothetical protein